MIEVELFGEDLAPDSPSPDEVAELCGLAARSRGVEDGHVAVQYVSSSRIAELNARHRGKSEPTDVLSFRSTASRDSTGRAPRRRGSWAM